MNKLLTRSSPSSARWPWRAAPLRTPAGTRQLQRPGFRMVRAHPGVCPRPAVAPDGAIFIAVMAGKQGGAFRSRQPVLQGVGPATRAPSHGLLVDRKGIVWTTGNGNGTLGRLDPASGAMRELPTPTRDGGPHTLVISDDGSTIWFTLQSGNRIGRLDTASGK